MKRVRKAHARLGREKRATVAERKAWASRSGPVRIRYVDPATLRGLPREGT